MKPALRYHKWHRVFSSKKHCNGTVLQSKWSNNAGNWIYEVAMDDGSRIWATSWTLSSESRIIWFVGSKGHVYDEDSNCEVINIVGFNSMYGDWLVTVRLTDGRELTIPQNRITRFVAARSQYEKSQNGLS